MKQRQIIAELITPLIVLIGVMMVTCMHVRAADASIQGVTTTGSVVSSVTVTTTTALSSDAKAIFALYESDGRLSGAQISATTISSGSTAGTYTLIPTSEITIGTGQYVRVMLWDYGSSGIGMHPVCASYKYDPSLSASAGDGVIHLNGDSINADGIDNVTVSGTTVTISAAGDYEIEGTLDDGQIIVNAAKADEVNITLEGVTATNSTNAPFYGENGKITLILGSGTTNTFTDAATYTYASTSIDEPNACVFSKRDLTIKGDGTLTVNGNYNNGIGSKADLKLSNGIINANGVNNAVKGNDSVTVKTGVTLTVVSTGDGIKSDTEDEEGSGIVTVSGGTLNIKSGADGIQSYRETLISGGDLTINSTGDAVKSDLDVEITGGTLNGTAAEDGIQSGTSSDSATATATPTATAATTTTVSTISISGGDITINSTQDGITSTTGSITITGGIFNITAGYDGIQASTTVDISAGDFTIKTNGGYTNTTTTDTSCKGIKGTTSITISGGTFNENTRDDSVHSNGTVTISGGDIEAYSGDDGIHADTTLNVGSDAVINILYSYEGLEAQTINVSGGTTHVTTTDDGVNANGGADSSSTATPAPGGGGRPGSSSGGPGGGVPTQGNGTGLINITGGYVYVNASGDGLDANGSITMSGGTVLVNGPTANDNGALDYDNTFTMTGGTLVAAGSSGMAQNITASGSTQAGVLIKYNSTQSAGTMLAINNSSGTNIVTFKPCKAYQSVVVSSPNLVTGTKYTLYSGGSYSLNNTDGYFTGGTYTTGTQKTTFTPSSVSTSVSTS